MTPLLDYFWPSFAVGVVMAAIAATYVWRRRPDRLRTWLIADGAILAAIAASLLWSGPLGAGGRYKATVERQIADTLTYYEMTRIEARLGSAPLTRRVRLEGPADDFQRGELVRVIGDLPGVSTATWGHRGGALPIIVEGAIAALAGLLLGLFLAYLLERHRRYNAQWDW